MPYDAPRPRPKDLGYTIEDREHRMQVSGTVVSLLQQRPLTLMKPEEFNIPSDDGIEYYAGCPESDRGTLIVRRLASLPSGSHRIEQVFSERLNGFSGSPLFTSKRGELKVYGLNRQAKTIKSRVNGDVRSQIFEPPDIFYNSVTNLLKQIAQD